MKLLVINGPNLNMLGIREPDIYGKQDYQALCAFIQSAAEEAGVSVDIRQSNHEGVLIDEIQKAREDCGGIVINPAAYSHTSIAMADALRAVALPAVEVHITDPEQREPFRRVSYTGMACCKTIKGQGIDGYRQAILYLKEQLKK